MVIILNKCICSAPTALHFSFQSLFAKLLTTKNKPFVAGSRNFSIVMVYLGFNLRITGQKQNTNEIMAFLCR